MSHIRTGYSLGYKKTSTSLVDVFAFYRPALNLELSAAAWTELPICMFDTSSTVTTVIANV